MVVFFMVIIFYVEYDVMIRNYLLSSSLLVPINIGIILMGRGMSAENRF